MLCDLTFLALTLLTLDCQGYSNGVLWLLKSLEMSVNLLTMKEDQATLGKTRGRCITSIFLNSNIWGSRMHPGKHGLPLKIVAALGQGRFSK
jgi:hypothetical protein